MSAIMGVLAPDLRLFDSNGTEVRLSNYIGKYVVLYFYPKDLTPVCTTQACDFRDQYEEFAKLNVTIIGISTDSAKRHAKFIEKYGLPYVLLSDEDHSVSEIYGVWKQKSMYGKQFMGIERSSFLINKRGMLIKEWRKVKVANHISDVLRYIQLFK
ncbi:thioredoxin-dependent thiol peroxidase [Paenibacillus chondroitinus]|uniref:thioredoxin-dependent peroxiredoxin n=1 Tax=Paenibacillus chondroitinus TaxID=59842 RepID=A0ABU6DGM8_9BACL|nr:MULTISPECIES: thioredoxin-dependent thiol peroxidase [Paenibacillus]MCY9659524.1 thioredoxin-dependent thiol peroxidase [Paenibacillus anseongense]MEB4796919.1 thioredoxin-dependent thiol peroxidase [Paenibacillus chondroitinus]